MIDAKMIDSGFLDKFGTPEQLEYVDKLFCPFTTWNLSWFHCGIEGWAIYFNSLKKRNRVPITCVCEGETDFLDCPRLKKLWHYTIRTHKR